jgi:Iron-containing redox enzyme
LWRKIRLVSGGLEQVAQLMWAHERLTELIPEFLLMDYSISRASTHLMESALGVACERASDDPVAACLADYLVKHIPEEMNHDEWLLADMETLGFKPEEVRKRISSPTAAALAGAQYYWMFHAHPVSILGYLMVLEGEPPPKAFLEDVIARSRIPARAFRTYLIHSQLDIEHRDELHEVLDCMPLGSEHTALLGISAMQTVEGLRRAFEEILELPGRARSRVEFPIPQQGKPVYS